MVDKGVGISEGEQKSIFKPFFRSNFSENAKMNPNRNGLGLHISRNICRALGGELTFKSSVGFGSTFIMKLACKVADE